MHTQPMSLSMSQSILRIDYICFFRCAQKTLAKVSDLKLYTLSPLLASSFPPLPLSPSSPSSPPLPQVLNLMNAVRKMEGLPPFPGFHETTPDVHSKRRSAKQRQLMNRYEGRREGRGEKAIAISVRSSRRYSAALLCGVVRGVRGVWCSFILQIMNYTTVPCTPCRVMPPSPLLTPFPPSSTVFLLRPPTSSVVLLRPPSPLFIPVVAVAGMGHGNRRRTQDRTVHLDGGEAVV